MKALIVEDQAMFCELLAKACERYLTEFEVRATRHAHGAREILREGDVTVMVLDIRLPDADGFEFAREALGLYPQLKIIGITAYCDPYAAYRLLDSPILAFLDKSTQAVTELGFAFQAVANGQKYYSPSIETILRKLGTAPDSFVKLLSRRQIVILREVGMGSSDERLGNLLNISAATVKWHRKQLMYKLGLCSHSDLVIYANKQGFSDIRCG